MLETGIKVRVKSREEVNKTLDGDGKCGNVYFNPKMHAFCGRILTLTVYFDNGAYATKETVYNWRPEWFDVIEDYEDFSDGIWSGTIKNQMLNLAMHHQVESGNNLDRALLESDIDYVKAFSNKPGGGFDYSDYSLEEWQQGQVWCANPPNYKWLNLKPEFVERIILRAKSENLLYRLIEHPNNPVYWFTWSKTPEGSKYWKDFNILYTQDVQILTNTTQNERNQIKLQRKKTSIRVGTVPEGCRVHGKRCKTSVRSRHLSYSARVGY